MADVELAASLPEDAWLHAVATAHPDATFRVLSATPAGGGAAALVELTGGDTAAVVADLDRQPAVADLDLLWSRGEESLLLVEADEPAPVGDHRDHRPAGVLTDRQREALSLAAAMGYYATPRESTLTEVADALGVAKSTASDLLHRAEGAVVERYLADVEDGSDSPPRGDSDLD